MSRTRLRRYFRHGLLPQLMVFEAVARLGGVTRAAQELHLAQPTVSLQLKKLSGALDVVLFEQRGRQLHLTAAGHALRETCEELTALLARTDERLAAWRGASAETLRLAAEPEARAVAARLIATFCARHPGVQVSLHLARRVELLSRIAAGADDVYLFALEVEGLPLERRWSVVHAKGRELAAAAAAVLREALLDVPDPAPNNSAATGKIDGETEGGGQAMEIARDYNAAADLIERNLAAGRGAKLAYVDDAGEYTFAQLAERVNRFGSGLQALGLEMEQRVLIAMLDGIDWPVAFLGAIRAGIIPIAVNTLLTTKDYEYMLSDSRAKALIVSEALLPQFAPLIGKLPFLKHVIVSGKDARGHLPFEGVMKRGKATLSPAPTTSDDACFWLYSSGSTGMPKGTVHVHSSMAITAKLYAEGVLGMKESDTVFSAAKLFFAYGLGNAMTFTLYTGATAVLMAERPTPAAVFNRLINKKPTVFFGVPTLYAAMLAAPDFPKKEALSLRTCVSAGEALPPQIAKSFKAKTGLDILDGIGSTEMLHIFLSNRPGELRHGTTGKAVGGYELRLVDEQGNPVKQGELGELQISGPTSASHYWNNREKTRSTFIGGWTKSGDKYSVDADGFYAYGGRSDDMLKVSGIWVSPAEVEAALVSHDAVLEAAVVGHEDEQKLVKPKAYVVLKPGQPAPDSLKAALQQHVKDKLAPYKYPRWIEFLNELPKTATGKIQRFKLRN